MYEQTYKYNFFLFKDIKLILKQFKNTFFPFLFGISQLYTDFQCLLQDYVFTELFYSLLNSMSQVTNITEFGAGSPERIEFPNSLQLLGATLSYPKTEQISFS